MQNIKYQNFWKSDSFLLIKLLILIVYFGFYWTFIFWRLFSVRFDDVLVILLELWHPKFYLDSWALDFDLDKLLLYRSFLFFGLDLELLAWFPTKAFLFSFITLCLSTEGFKVEFFRKTFLKSSRGTLYVSTVFLYYREILVRLGVFTFF